jgi:hypothetical protein
MLEGPRREPIQESYQRALSRCAGLLDELVQKVSTRQQKNAKSMEK